MRAKAQKWGNSLAIRIPKGIVEQANIHENDELEMAVINRQIRISPRQKEYKLDDLLAGISKANLHNALDFGEAEGGW